MAQQSGPNGGLGQAYPVRYQPTPEKKEPKKEEKK